jgi:hypothetical protein
VGAQEEGEGEGRIEEESGEEMHTIDTRPFSPGFKFRLGLILFIGVI